MGGKVWSKEEEAHFWLELIPHSPKRLGDDIVKNEEKTWNWVCDQMIEYMGDKARRKYTHLCVFEHYFLNANLGRFSPNVGKLPSKYWKHEQELMKAKQEALEKQGAEAEDEDEEAAGEPNSEAEADASGESSTGNADSPIEVDAAGDKESPIVINCQYPMVPGHHGHALTPPSTVQSARPSFGFPGFLPPPPQFYFPRFPANHNHLATAESEDDSLFVTQRPASRMDVTAHTGATAITIAERRQPWVHEALSSAQFLGRRKDYGNMIAWSRSTLARRGDLLENTQLLV